MPVDRGGLDYTIKVRDQFSAPLGKFKRDVDSARQSLEQLASASRRTGSAEGVRRLTDATQNATRASRRRAQAVEIENRRLRVGEQVRKDMAREVRRGIVAERRAIEARRRNFRIERRTVSAVQARRSAEQDLTKVQNRRLRIEQRRLAASEQNLRLSRQERQRLGILSRRERSLLKVQRERQNEVDRLRKAQAEQSNRRLRQLRAEREALEAINRAERRRAREEALNRRGFRSAGSGAGITAIPETAQTQRLTRFQRIFQSLRGDIEAADVQANRISFTFRRLFGILAAFTIAREAVNSFVQSIRTLFDASRQIETTRLGIASVLLSTAEVRDATGNLVEGTEGLEIAIGAAVEQTEKLRFEALRTTATFEELATTFQVALGPGLQAGLDVDQIRRFTTQISLAAQAIGLEQRQLAEEIRSILTGTINRQQTRIANVLGLTNADIRQAQEAGELFEFLNEQFAGFEAAGERAANTLGGLASKVNDAFRNLLATGGQGLIETVKDALSDIENLLVQVDEEAQTADVNPKLVRSVALLSDGFSRAVVAARALGETLGSGGALAFASSLGNLIGLTAEVIAPFIAGLSDALVIVDSIFRIFSNLLRAIGKVIGAVTGRSITRQAESILRTVGQIVGLLAAAAAISGTLLAISRSYLVVVGAFRLAYNAATKAAQALATVQGVITAFAAATNPLIAALVVLAGLALAIFVDWQSVIGFISGQLRFISGQILGGIKDEVEAINGGVQEIAKGRGSVDSIVESLEKSRDLVREIREGVQSLREITDAREGIFFPGGLEASNTGSALSRIAQDIRVGNEKIRDVLRVNNQESEDLQENFEGLTDRLRELQKQRAAYEQVVEESTTIDNVILERDRVEELGEEWERVRRRIKEVSEERERSARTDEILQGFRDTPGTGFLTDLNLSFLQLGNNLNTAFREGLGDLREGDLGALGQGFASTFFPEARASIEELDRELVKLKRDRENLAREGAIQAAQLLKIDRQINAVQIKRQTESERLLELREAALEAATEFVAQQILSNRLDIRAEAIRQRRQQAEERINFLYDFRIRALGILGQSQRARLLEIRQQNDELRLQRDETLRNLEADRRRAEEARAGVLATINGLKLLRERAVENEASPDILSGFDEQIEEARTNLERLQKVAATVTQRIREATVAARRSIEIGRIEESLQGIRSGLQGTMADQLGVAFIDLLQSLPSRFEAVFSTLQNIVRSFSSTASSLIVDIFDPTKDTNIRERFGRFLQQIAQQIIQTLIQVAVASLILNSLTGGILGSLFPAAGRAAKNLSSLGAIGRAEGGPIDRKDGRRARPSPAHYLKPKGRNKGGAERPKGLHPSDTIPIWVAQNEWVVRARSVAKAGHDALHRINEGAFDRGALRAALGLGDSPVRSAVSMANKGQGMISGGRARAATEAASRREGSPQTGAAVAFIAPTEESVRRLLASGGGRVALLDAIGENSDEIRGRLGV